METSTKRVTAGSSTKAEGGCDNSGADQKEEVKEWLNMFGL